jgi:hypothetical protein
LGVNPVHFQGGIGEEVFPLGSNSCNDLWPRHNWQQPDRVSHEEIAYAIQDAEIEIAQVLGYFPAPFWIAQEVHQWQRWYRQDFQRVNGRDVTGRRVGLQTRFGKIISAGQRAVTYIGTATTTGNSLTYSDADGDGFIDRATVEMPTDETNICELKVYHVGTGGNQRWEIRPAREKSISSGTATFIFPAWLFIDPDIQSRYPTTERFRGINLDTTDNYVTSVDVYREYNDTTAQSAELFWEPATHSSFGCSTCGGSGCTACVLTSQDGCIHIREAQNGLVVPTPATYSDGAWSSACFAGCRDPDEVKIWYYAGALDNLNLRGSTCNVLPPRMERAIAWLATTKLIKPMCACPHVTAVYRRLQVDLMLSGTESYQVSEDDLNNPFGTQYGSVMAWKYIHNVAEHILKGVAV